MSDRVKTVCGIYQCGPGALEWRSLPDAGTHGHIPTWYFNACLRDDVDQYVKPPRGLRIDSGGGAWGPSRCCSSTLPPSMNGLRSRLRNEQAKLS